jgi:hypothetical protein
MCSGRLKRRTPSWQTQTARGVWQPRSSWSVASEMGELTETMCPSYSGRWVGLDLRMAAGGAWASVLGVSSPLELDWKRAGSGFSFPSLRLLPLHYRVRFPCLLQSLPLGAPGVAAALAPLGHAVAVLGGTRRGFDRVRRHPPSHQPHLTHVARSARGFEKHATDQATRSDTNRPPSLATA